jgi:hypothetical protein
MKRIEITSKKDKFTNITIYRKKEEYVKRGWYDSFFLKFNISNSEVLFICKSPGTSNCCFMTLFGAPMLNLYRELTKRELFDYIGEERALKLKRMIGGHKFFVSSESL